MNFRLWDNFQPYENQKENLIEIVKSFKPYTNKVYKSKKEFIYKRMVNRILPAINEEIEKLKERIKHNDGNIREMKEKLKEVVSKKDYYLKKNKEHLDVFWKFVGEILKMSLLSIIGLILMFALL